MRCKACNVLLDDWEIARKDKSTGMYTDLCTECLTVSNEELYNEIGVDKHSDSVYTILKYSKET